MSAVWSWADVPGLDAPPSASRRAPRRRRRWSLASLMVNEYMPAPAGATLRHAVATSASVARRHGLRFAVHVTAPGDTGLFVRRVPTNGVGPGVKTVRGPVPAGSRLVTPAEVAP